MQRAVSQPVPIRPAHTYAHTPTWRSAFDVSSRALPSIAESPVDRPRAPAPEIWR